MIEILGGREAWNLVIVWGGWISSCQKHRNQHVSQRTHGNGTDQARSRLTFWVTSTSFSRTQASVRTMTLLSSGVPGRRSICSIGWRGGGDLMRVVLVVVRPLRGGG